MIKLKKTTTFNYGKSLPKHKRKSGKIPVYGSSGNTGTHNEALIDGPGVILGRKGNIGSVYYSDEGFFPIDTVYYVTKEDTDLDLKYLYYLLQTLNLKHTSDSVVPGLNRDYLYNIEIQELTLPEQKRIANILSSFDDKIELLKEQNKTLENIAQTIFKQWFIDFNFPNSNGKPYKDNGGRMKESELGMIPEGWEVKSLIDIANFINGLAMQNYRPEKGEEGLPVIKIRELKDGYSFNTDRATKKLDTKYVVNNGDVVFSWSGSLELDLWKYCTGALNQHLFKVISEKYPKWFYYHWIKHYLPQFRQIAADKATTMGHIKRSHLKEALVVIPNNELDSNKYLIFDVLLDKMTIQNKMTLNLTNQRDLLINKLIN